MTEGTIFNVKHFEIHDGPGIRTTLFLKGCPLRCRWCHNPEGLRSEIQKDGRTGCSFGRVVSVEAILPELLTDKMFYDSSGGGVTLSGGEPTMQPLFALELLKALKNEGVHTALDTSLYVSEEVLDSLLPYTDILLVDVKAFDDSLHKQLTGVSNRIILDNLRRADMTGKPYEIRVPLIPGCNEDQMESIGLFLSGLSRVDKVRLLKYHDFGRSKYRALGMDYPMGDAILSNEHYEEAYNRLKSFGLNVIHR